MTDAAVASIDRIHRAALALHGEPDETAIAGLVNELEPLLPPDASGRLVAGVLARVRGLGPLDALLADDAVSEVMVNGGGRVCVKP